MDTLVIISTDHWCIYLRTDLFSRNFLPRSQHLNIKMLSSL